MGNHTGGTVESESESVVGVQTVLSVLRWGWWRGNADGRVRTCREWVPVVGVGGGPEAAATAGVPVPDLVAAKDGSDGMWRTVIKASCNVSTL